MMPRDSTPIELDEVKRRLIFQAGTPLHRRLLCSITSGDNKLHAVDVMTVAIKLLIQASP